LTYYRIYEFEVGSEWMRAVRLTHASWIYFYINLAFWWGVIIVISYKFKHFDLIISLKKNYTRNEPISIFNTNYFSKVLNL